MALKGCHITTLAFRLRFFSSCGGLRNELLSTWHSAARDTIICDGELFLPLPSPSREVIPLSAVVHAVVHVLHVVHVVHFRAMA